MKTTSEPRNLRSTANLGVKVLRICLGEAVRQELLAVNPAVRVKLLKSTAESKRRAFTLDEIKRILRACPTIPNGAASCFLARISDSGSANWQNCLFNSPVGSDACRSPAWR